MHPQHQGGVLQGPLVAIRPEHQRAVNEALDEYLGTREATATMHRISCLAAQPSPAPTAASGLQTAAQARMAALRARVREKRRIC